MKICVIGSGYVGLVTGICFASNDKHNLVSIPPFVWNGFCSTKNEIAILANCSDIPHDKEEIKRIPFDDKKIPYNWKF